MKQLKYPPGWTKYRTPPKQEIGSYFCKEACYECWKRGASPGGDADRSL
jgi:hypothetical protein